MGNRKSCDVLIVGAGIIGTAVGDRLKEQGIQKVLIIEKESMPATGSTSRSAGGIRQQFGDEAKVRAAAFSFSVFESFRARYGVDPCFRQHGYLILESQETGARRLKTDVELQRRIGLDTNYLEPEEISAWIPSLYTEDLKGASFNGSDGYLDPHTVVQGFLKMFKARGGCIEFDVKAEGLILEGTRVKGVFTQRGEIHAGVTLLASGPHTGPFLERAGLKLPLRTCRRQIFMTGPVPGISMDWPLVLDVKAPFYFRPEGEGVIMSLAEVEEMDPPKEGNEIPLSRQNLSDLAEKASLRCPLLKEARIQSGWAGLRTLTPDERPILGPISSMEGLFVASGFSGHGITLAPYAAEFMAREIEDNLLEASERALFLPSRFFDPA